MDDADRAQKETDLELSLALQNREQELPETGACHWCEAIIDQGHFCDSDCRDDHAKLKVMKG